jgi:multicomponent Na+:H+ antiporter subunit B
MIHGTSSPFLILGSRALAPVIQIFALYVIAHGHYSPGGGFQGGALFAASIILMRLTVGSAVAELHFPRSLDTPLSSLGALIYAAIGVAALAAGGLFLDYAAIPLPGLEGAPLRSMWILLIEVGVGLAVTATLVSLYDDLMEPSEDA